MKRLSFLVLLLGSVVSPSVVRAQGDIYIRPFAPALFEYVTNNPDPEYQRWYLESQRAFMKSDSGSTNVYFNENLMPFFKNGMAFTLSKNEYTYLGVDPQTGYSVWKHKWEVKYGYVYDVVRINGQFESARWFSYGMDQSGERIIGWSSVDDSDIHWWYPTP